MVDRALLEISPNRYAFCRLAADGDIDSMVARARSMLHVEAAKPQVDLEYGEEDSRTLVGSRPKHKKVA